MEGEKSDNFRLTKGKDQISRNFEMKSLFNSMEYKLQAILTNNKIVFTSLPIISSSRIAFDLYADKSKKETVAELYGQVLNYHGKPIPHEVVRIYKKKNDEREIRIRTDISGSFTTYLEPGDYYLSLEDCQDERMRIFRSNDGLKVYFRTKMNKSPLYRTQLIGRCAT